MLELAAQRAGWGSPLPSGRARGVAVHESFSTLVAQVAGVSLGRDGLPAADRPTQGGDGHPHSRA